MEWVLIYNQITGNATLMSPQWTVDRIARIAHALPDLILTPVYVLPF